jgi:hypothetical protein
MKLWPTFYRCFSEAATVKRDIGAKRDPSAAEIDWLDSIEPETGDVRVAGRMRRITAAAGALDAARAELDAAVAASRATGDTWDVIGIALGVSRQAASQRFGQRGQKQATTVAPTKQDPAKKAPQEKQESSPRVGHPAAGTAARKASHAPSARST